MALAVTDIMVCNLALGALGSPSITTISPAISPVQRTLELWYDETKNQVLREHVWNFSKTTMALARTGTPINPNYADEYQLPPDFVRFVDVLDSSGYSYITSQGQDKDITGNNLLLNASGSSTVYLIYVSNAVTPARFSSDFKKCFVALLASNIAMAVTKKTSDKTTQLAIYKQELARAKTVDGQENPPQLISSSRWMAARFRNSGYSGYPNVVAP